MTNAANAITTLNNLKSVVTALETGVRTGDVQIDAQTRALLTTRLDLFMAAVFDNGSRSQQNAAAAKIAAANNGLQPIQDALFTQLDAFVKAIDAQVAVLTNPTQTPRRQHITLS